MCENDDPNNSAQQKVSRITEYQRKGLSGCPPAWEK